MPSDHDDAGLPHATAWKRQNPLIRA
jgi:hypothetical protein